MHVDPVQARDNQAPARTARETYRRSRSDILNALTSMGLSPSISATEQELRALEDHLGELLAENDLLQDDLSNQGTRQP